jgi:hypothetical protein
VLAATEDRDGTVAFRRVAHGSETVAGGAVPRQAGPRPTQREGRR